MRRRIIFWWLDLCAESFVTSARNCEEKISGGWSGGNLSRGFFLLIVEKFLCSITILLSLNLLSEDILTRIVALEYYIRTNFYSPPIQVT